MARALLDAGADATEPNLLMKAAYGGHIEAIRLLMERGAGGSAEVLEDALKEARNRGRREAALLLRQAQADLRLREVGGSFPLPRHPAGTRVRTIAGTPREGWVVLAEWHFKMCEYGYQIEVETEHGARKTITKRYWQDELEPI